MAIGQAPITRLYYNEPETVQVEYDHEVEKCAGTVHYKGTATGQFQANSYINPEVAMVHNILMEVNADVQNEGWVFNREDHYPLTPDKDGYLTCPNNILRMDVYENEVYRTTDLVQRKVGYTTS